MTEPLEVDDLVTGRAAEYLGEGVIPTKAILLVETMSEEGTGFRFVRTSSVSSWHALGMLRSAQLRVETEDLNNWEDE